MLYTDGLVEVPGRDIDAGIDRLLGEADRLIASGFGAGRGPARADHAGRPGHLRRLRAGADLAVVTAAGVAAPGRPGRAGLARLGLAAAQLP